MNYYFLKNLNDGTYWDGKYGSEQWNKIPRLFKTPAALLSSLYPVLPPLSWLDEFKKINGEPPQNHRYDSAWSEWLSLKLHEWRKFTKNKNSVEILKMFETQGYILFEIKNVEESLLTLAKQI